MPFPVSFNDVGLYRTRSPAVAMIADRTVYDRALVVLRSVIH